MIAVALITAKTVFTLRTAHETPKVISRTLPVLGEIPATTLTDQTGKNFNLEDLKGKVWIADFVFTHCAGPCPLMTGSMSRMAKELAAEDAVRFVSFSVDPERDTPEVLAKYAERYQADPEKWVFLTGEKSKIFDLSQKAFHLGVVEVPLEERTNPDQLVGHSTKFILVDTAGKIRGYYENEDPGSRGKLMEDVKTLLTSSTL